jgi:hypothetical protein
MPALAKHRACSRSDPTWFVRITESSRAKRGGRSRSCKRSRLRQVAGLSVLSCESDGGVRPSGRGRWIDAFTGLILRAVRGQNIFVQPRVPETVPPAVAPVLEKALANEAAYEAKLEDWLVQRRKRNHLSVESISSAEASAAPPAAAAP